MYSDSSRYLHYRRKYKILQERKKYMNDLIIFENAEFGQVRTVTINSEPYFCLTDICKALDIKNSRDVISRLNKGGVVSTDTIDNLGRNQQANFINEPNMYKLIFQSRKESAERFTDWVTGEVLPSIRKTGTYQKPLTQYEIMQKSLDMLTEQDGRLTKLENNMTIDYGQQLQIEKLVNKQVTDALGGKESAAYKEIGKKVFSECNRDVKNYFNVNSRNNIAVIDFEKARQFIKGWKPSYTTQLLINDCNSQLCMN